MFLGWEEFVNQAGIKGILFFIQDSTRSVIRYNMNTEIFCLACPGIAQPTHGLGHTVEQPVQLLFVGRVLGLHVLVK